MKGKKIQIELLSNYPEWWRYNAYMSVVSYGENSEVIDYINVIDEIYPISETNDGREKPETYLCPRITAIESAPCSYVMLYIYVITNTFPQSTLIRESPPFEIELKVRCDGKRHSAKIFMVNQWGGLTVSEYKIQ